MPGHHKPDADGTIASYAGNFGDGSAGSGVTQSHAYASAGTYTATLTVTDDNGVTDTDSIVISVVIDDDGDGVSPPTDCNDSNASINPTAADTLDASRVDSNCDGVDGVLASTTFVSSAGADTVNCGTLVAPCLTLGQGVTRGGAHRDEQGEGEASHAPTLIAHALDDNSRSVARDTAQKPRAEESTDFPP